MFNLLMYTILNLKPCILWSLIALTRVISPKRAASRGVRFRNNLPRTRSRFFSNCTNSRRRPCTWGPEVDDHRQHAATLLSGPNKHLSRKVLMFASGSEGSGGTVSMMLTHLSNNRLQLGHPLTRFTLIHQVKGANRVRRQKRMFLVYNCVVII